VSTVIICHGLEGVLLDGGAAPPDGAYLEEADFEYAGGFGAAKWTEDVARALRFESMLDALVFWRTQSKTRPYRSDGRPNKPLTAYTVEIRELDE
jgi:hypothetical protein